MALVQRPELGQQQQRSQIAVQFQRDLERAVRRLLSCRHFNQLETIDVIIEGTTITLHGTVSSSGDQRACIECCRHIYGVRKVIDRLEVKEAATDGGKDVPRNNQLVLESRRSFITNEPGARYKPHYHY